MDFFLWKLQVKNLHILHQSNEILHIFVEPFIYDRKQLILNEI